MNCERAFAAAIALTRRTSPTTTLNGCCPTSSRNSASIGMRILILTSNLAQGGAQRQITILARSIAELGHEVGIATMYPGGVLESELVATSVQVFPLNKRGRWDAVGFLFAIYKVLRTFQPDVFQTFLTVPNVIGSLYRPLFGKIPLVWGVRNSDMDLDRYDALTRLFAKLEVFLSASCDLAIANSHVGLNVYASKGFRPKRFEVIENGIDTERFRWRSDQRTRLRSLWDIPERAKLCLTVGRMDPMKDYDTLISSIRYWPTHSFLAIVGSGIAEAASKLRATIDRLGVGAQVRLLGSMNDVENAYSAADAFVLSSSFGEGFSNVVAEAMSCGLPIVATDVGDTKRIIGPCGRIVPPRDPESLGHAVADVLAQGKRDDPDPRSRIISNYSVSRMVERTLQLYEEALGVSAASSGQLPQSSSSRKAQLS
jgi:glycosyltransferase involved in cell wall biosynthesis